MGLEEVVKAKGSNVNRKIHASFTSCFSKSFYELISANLQMFPRTSAYFFGVLYCCSCYCIMKLNVNFPHILVAQKYT